MACRPNQAFETRAFSASAASSRCSSGERFTDRRLEDDIGPKIPTMDAGRSSLQQFASVWPVCQAAVLSTASASSGMCPRAATWARLENPRQG